MLEIESIEAEAWAELQECLPAGLRARLGVDVQRRSGAVLLIASGTPELAINKVMGLGLQTPLSERELDDVVAAYAAAGAKRFIIQWHPQAQPAAALEWLSERGFVLVSHIAKLCRPMSVPDADVTEVAASDSWQNWHEASSGGHQPGGAHSAGLASALRIDEIGAEDAVTFETVVARSLGVPEGLEAGIRSTLGRPGWRFYLVRDGERPIAGGALCTRGEHAWLGFGATLESDRKRGAQTLLLARRMRDAAADGCQWVSADTLAETVDRPNQSYRNMRRMGFSLAYERPNYVLELNAATPTRCHS